MLQELLEMWICDTKNAVGSCVYQRARGKPVGAWLQFTFHSPSCPELRRCSPKSQPNTLSRRMPLCFSFCLVGLDFMNERKKVISFPCFLDTEGKAKKGGMLLRFHTCRENYSNCGLDAGSTFTHLAVHWSETSDKLLKSLSHCVNSAAF